MNRRPKLHCFRPLLVAVCASLATGTAAQAQTNWNKTSGGPYVWNDAANWSAGIPNSTTAIANVTANLSAVQTINLATGVAADMTVNDLNLGDPTATGFAFTVAPGVVGSTLLFDGTNPSLDITGQATANIISAPVQFNADPVLRSQTTAGNAFSGGLKDGGVARTITFNNDTNGVARAAASLEGQFAVTTVAAIFNAGTTIAVDDVRLNTNFAGALGTAAANSVTMTGAGQLYVSGGTHVNNITLNSTGWVETAGLNLGALRIENSTLSGSVTLMQNTLIGVNANNTGTLSGAISGAFDITRVGGTGTALQGVLQLSGNNSGWSGNLRVDRGTVRLNNADALGTGTQTTVNGNGFGAQLDLAGGFTYGTSKNLILTSGLLANTTHRATLNNQAGSNTWAGTITLDSAQPGGALAQATSNGAAATTLTLSGNITGTGTNYPSLFFVRGAQAGIVANTAVFNMPNTDLGKTDVGTWTINSTGNIWRNTIAADGTLALGVTDAFDTTANLTLGQGSGTTGQVNMNGFDQTVAAFASDPLSSSAGLILRNPSATTGSTLTFTTTGTDIFKGTLSNTTAGVALSLVKNGAGTFTLNSTAPSVVVPAWTDGSIAVNNGTFNLTGAVLLGGAANTLTLADGAKLGGEGSFGGSVTMGTVTGTTLTVDGSTTATAFKLGGTLTLNGATQVAVIGSVPNTGSLRIIDVPATPGGTGLTSFLAPPGFNTPVFSFNAGGYVEMTYSVAVGALQWNNNSADGLWNLASSVNWQDQTPTNTAFYNGSPILLDDLLATNQSISVVGAQNPSEVRFDNDTIEYLLTDGGAGKIDAPIIRTAASTGKAIIAFNNLTTQPVTIDGGTLQIGNAGDFGATGTGTVTNNATLAYNYGATASVTTAAPITNTLTLNRIGAGALTFSSAVSNTATGIITVGGSGSTTFNGAVTNLGSITTADSATVLGNSVISGAGGTVTVGGTSVLTLTKANTYTGLTTVQNGAKLIANYNSGTAVTVLPAANTLQIDSGSLAQVMANDAAYTFAAIVTGAGTLELNPRTVGPGTTALAVGLTGANTGFDGTLLLSSPVTGTYRVQPAAPAQVGTASIVVKNGAQFYTSAAGPLTNNIKITGEGYADTLGKIGALRIDGTTTYSGNIVIDTSAKIGTNNGTVTLSGTISGGTLVAGSYNTGSTIILTGTNSYGNTEVNGASITGTGTRRLNIGAGGTTGSLGTGPVTINGDATNGVLGFDRSDGYTLAVGQTITGVGTDLTKTFVDCNVLGTGFDNGGETIGLGLPAAGGSLRAGVSRADTVTTLSGTVEAGQLLIGVHAGTTSTQNAAVTLGATASISVNNILLAGGGNTATLGNTNGASLTIQSGAIVKAAGNLHLGEGNSSSASVNQIGGDVTVGGGFRVGHWPNETSNYTVASGTLTINAIVPSFPYTAGVAEVAGGMYLGIDGTGIFNQNGGTVSTGFVVLDNRGDTALGVDTYNLNSGILALTSSYGLVSRNASTAFSWNGGTIRADANALLDSHTITVAANSTLDTNGNIVTALAPLLGAAKVSITSAGKLQTNDSVTLGFGGGGSLNGVSVDIAAAATLEANRTGTDTWSGVVTGSGPFVKSNTGTLILSGPSPAYAGTADVNDGTLRIDGTLGGTVDVNAGTLAGTGAATGTVTVLAGATLAPGASIESLGTGALTMDLGSAYNVEIDSSLATADSTDITGNVSLASTLNTTDIAGAPAVLPFATKLIIMTYTGVLTGTFTGLAEGANVVIGLNTFKLSYADANRVTLTTPPDPYIAWAAGYGLTGTKADDDDKDGASNLLEFATNSNPATNGAGARVYWKMHTLGADNALTFTTAVRKSAVFAAAGSTQTSTKDGVLYTVEASNDLATWNVVVVTELNPADSTAVQAAMVPALPTPDADWEWHTFRTDDGTAIDPDDFIRLRVAATP